MRLNVRKLIGGLSLLFLITGALLICFIPGGLFNQIDFGLGRVVVFDRPGHIIGFILMGVGAVGFVVLFSLEKTGGPPRHELPHYPDRGLPGERPPYPERGAPDERNPGQFRVG
jgi:hypothetical protein